MSKHFRMLMIGAMYENGGNMVHRFLDGHPQLFVYPFEFQIGTRLVMDHLSSMFPRKYRWPVFSLDASVEEDYKDIIDEECKVRSRTPHVSKFRHVPFEFSDDHRRDFYVKYIKQVGRSRRNNVAAFFEATFDAWINYHRTGEEEVYVGYSPIIVVDTEKILADFPDAYILHVVRNPWSAYADHKKRPVPLTLEEFMLCWTVNQYFALILADKYRARVHIIRAEDVMENPLGALSAACIRMGLEEASTLAIPTWNGIGLEEISPWGTIQIPTPQANRAASERLSNQERGEIRTYAWRFLEDFDYGSFL